MPEVQKIQWRRGTAAAWTTANPVLSAGTPGFETDTGKFKVGDGVKDWKTLAYQGDVTLTGAQALSNKTLNTPTVNTAVLKGVTTFGLHGSLNASTTYGNVGVGAGANGASTGINNTAVGLNAQKSLAAGARNTSVGSGALFTADAGNNNSVLGVNAAYDLTSGSDNTIVGFNAAHSPAGTAAYATTTGSKQTVVGAQAGQSSATQVDEIVAVGYNATAGGRASVALGFGARSTHDNSVALGDGVGTSASNQVCIGTKSLAFIRAVGATVSVVPTSGSTDQVLTLPEGAAATLVGAVPVPASKSAAGTPGQIAVAAGFVYVCVAANRWQRAPLADW
jgi:hypothetical protein